MSDIGVSANTGSIQSVPEKGKIKVEKTSDTKLEMKYSYTSDNVNVKNKGGDVPGNTMSIADAQRNVADLQTQMAQNRKNMETKMEQVRLEMENQLKQSQLEAQRMMVPFKLTEEKTLGGILNDQLSHLETVVSKVHERLDKQLDQTSAQKGQLPLILDNKSVEYSFYKQIEGQEDKINDKIKALESYVQGMRTRSNSLLAKVNSNVDIVEGTGAIDKRIADLRHMIGELSASPYTKDLLASRLR